MSQTESPALGGRETAAMWLLLMSWGNFPTELLNKAKGSLGHIALTGQNVTNIMFYANIAAAVGYWATSFAVLYLFLTKDRFQKDTLVFLVMLTGVFTLLYGRATAAELPGFMTFCLTVLSPALLVLACVCWARREELVSFARRLRIRSPMTLTN
jgi:hypothetical protein